jgi:hypothetical protein
MSQANTFKKGPQKAQGSSSNHHQSLPGGPSAGEDWIRELATMITYIREDIKTPQNNVSRTQQSLQGTHQANFDQPTLEEAMFMVIR